MERLRRKFGERRDRSYIWRRDQLRQLRRMLREREPAFHAALAHDLGKCEFEAVASETGFVVAEIDFALRHLRRWMKPRRVATPLIVQPGFSRIVYEPRGTVLIIGPWNYPLNLVLAPLVGAIAAGNSAVIKPSELAPQTSTVLARYLPEYLNSDCFAVVEGGSEVTTELLTEVWDYIFFTGGTGVGQIVMRAAAEHLTPVTLELGGKSPCIVDEDAPLEVAARRITWGKFLNAGQTCVAPDYALVHRRLYDDFLAACVAQVAKFYGADPSQSPDFGRIINGRHFERLTAMLADGRIVTGGQSNAADRFIAPTILADVSPTAAVMQAEIFGPILPVLPVADLDEALRFVAARPHPLSLYYFSTSRAKQQRVTEQSTSGSLCLNDVVFPLSVPGLPFGGVGASGLGAYHGFHSFETFSHRKAVLSRWIHPDIPLRYAPYQGKLGLLRWLFRT